MNAGFVVFLFLLLNSFSSQAMVKSVLKYAHKNIDNVRHLSVQHCNYQDGSLFGKVLKISTAVLGVCILVEDERKKTHQLHELDSKIATLAQNVAALKNEKE